MEGMTPITVRCGACGAKLGTTSTPSTEDPELIAYAPEVFVVARYQPTRRRRSKKPTEQAQAEDELPIAGPGGDWSMRRHPTPVECPARTCNAVYQLSAIRSRVVDARRRGATVVKVHREPAPNV